MKLTFPITQLQKAGHKTIVLQGEADLQASLQKRFANIINAKKVKIDGKLWREGAGWQTDLQVATTLIVPSTRSLAPVKLPLQLAITERYVLAEDDDFNEEETKAEQELDTPAVIAITDDQIDLQKAIEDHLSLAIPTQVLTPAEKKADKMPTGEGWQVMSEHDYQAQKQAKPAANPELAKLKSLLTKKEAAEDSDDQSS